MELKVKSWSDSIKQEMDKLPFSNGEYYVGKSQNFLIPENETLTYIEPESFDFSDVYGNCELTQLIIDGKVQSMVTKFEFEKNKRSFESEAIAQDKAAILTDGYVDMV